MMPLINISTEYTNTPMARYRDEGPFSGEDFRETLLKPKFIEATEKGEKLIINLDGCYGYPTSFIKEAFGGLSRLYGSKNVLNIIEFISEDEPSIVDKIKNYIRQAEMHGRSC